MTSNEALAALGINLKDKKQLTFKVGIAGASGSGKTYAALTFPNPVVLDYDNGLSAHQGRDLISFPIWDDEWCKANGCQPMKGNVDGLPISCVNKRDIIVRLLDKLEKDSLLTEEHTLILDSWTKLQEAFDAATHCQPSFSKDGKIDSFSFWKRKIAFSEQIMSRLMGLKCSVVVLFHLFRERDDEGKETGKWQPFMDGKFKDKVASYFDNFFGQVCLPSFDPSNTRMREFEPIKHMLTERENYLWQVKPTLKIDAKCALPGVTTPFVKAGYESIKSAFAK